MQTLKYVWNADIEVSVEWRHWDISGMQTSGYQWITDIGVSVECRHWGISRMQPLGVSVEYSHWDISGMRTLGYQWNADIGVSVEYRHWSISGMRILGNAFVDPNLWWSASVAEHELCCSPHTEKHNTHNITPVSISPLAPSPTKNSVEDKHSLL